MISTRVWGTIAVTRRYGFLGQLPHFHGMNHYTFNEMMSCGLADLLTPNLMIIFNSNERVSHRLSRALDRGSGRLTNSDLI